MKKTKKGFTLIELLVVIGIIGLLASLAIVSLNSARAKARDAVRLANMQRIVTSLEQFYDSKGRYPSEVAVSITPDLRHGLGYSNSQAPNTFYTGLFSGGFKEMVGQVIIGCVDNGQVNQSCDLELTQPMPREPLQSSADTNTAALCGVAGSDLVVCEYSYMASDNTVANLRGFQNFTMSYKLESSAPKQFGDGLLCVANRKGTKCSQAPVAGVWPQLD